MKAPKTAKSAPIRPADSPSRVPATTMTRKMPGMAKLPMPHRNAQLRRNGWLQRNLKPSAIYVPRGNGSRSRRSWNGVRIARSERKEKVYETASARNGTARPTP